MSMKKEKLKILFFGGGAVGSYFAGMMSKNGHDISMVTRGPHLEAIKNKGLTLETHWGNFNINLPVFEHIPRKKFDVIILAVKTYSVEQILDEVKASLSEHTKVLCIQNGIFTYKLLRKELPLQNVVNGLTYVDAVRVNPGVVKQFGQEARIVLGKSDAREKEKSRLQEITSRSDSNETQFEFSNDIDRSVWEKLIMVAASGSIMSYSGMSALETFKLNEYIETMHSMIFEMFNAAIATGVDLDKEFPKITLKNLLDRSDEIHSSLKEDLDHGRPLELDEILGEAIRVGTLNGVSMENCEKVYLALKKYVKGNLN